MILQELGSYEAGKDSHSTTYVHGLFSNEDLDINLAASFYDYEVFSHRYL
jgi:hypothetical protein